MIVGALRQQLLHRRQLFRRIAIVNRAAMPHRERQAMIRCLGEHRIVTHPLPLVAFEHTIKFVQLIPHGDIGQFDAC